LTARDAGELAISSISFWEIALLVAKRRLSFAIPAVEVRRQILESGIVELPVTGTIAVLAVELHDLHGDPADRFIAATALSHDATLLTSDKRLLNWRHKSFKRQNASK
jgi:PIN domain nuclease of toxin-antitoxin system